MACSPYYPDHLPIVVPTQGKDDIHMLLKTIKVSISAKKQRLGEEAAQELELKLDSGPTEKRWSTTNQWKSNV